MSNRLYTSIPAPKVPRNTFNLSRYNSLTMPYQRVCPTAIQEVIPGDKFFWSAEVFARLQPMVAPVMTDQKISMHAFFVPLRTINKHFDEFMFNNKAGNYTDVLPYVTLGLLYELVKSANTNYSSSRDRIADCIRLLDYIGLPFTYRSAANSVTFVSQWLTDNAGFENNTIRVNLAPFFAYTKVWTEYFRDENLVDDPFDVWTGYGYTDPLSWTGSQVTYISTSAVVKWRFLSCFLLLRPRAWQHDRFTSALPFAQRGPDVLLPVVGQVDMSVSGPADDGSVTWDASEEELVSNAVGAGQESGPISIDAEIGNISTTINDFRRAERLQRWYENSARGGVRPNEATLAHFGVRTPDASLYRAEFLGGTMQPIVISEVAQTSETSTTPQGTLAGKGTSYKSNRLFKHFFSEHGFVFVFTSALIRPAYFQGVPRIFSRMQRDEYYWPEFALLGEEPVFDKELFVDGSTTEDGVFGYVPRYSEYKSSIPEVHGDFRSSLDFWTNPRKFANQPQLNSEFIFGNPSKKMFAVTSDFADSLLVTIRHDVKASRLMPFYGVPTI